MNPFKGRMESIDLGDNGRPGYDSRSAPAERSLFVVPPIPHAPASRSGTGKILVAEDESSMREALANILRGRGFDVSVAATGTEALGALHQENFDAIVTDLLMPGADGITILRRAREVSPQTVVVLTTAHATVETVIEAMREGVADYILKPIPFGDLLRRLTHVLEWRDLAWETQVLRRAVDASTDPAPFLIGRSPAISQIRQLISKVAGTDMTVLITGESGVGKEVVARAIHDCSHLRDRLFLPVNCAAIPDSLLESQLFGHTKGAFTGADNAAAGLFHRADGGTLFLDEIGELLPHLQAKLLRAIAEKEILPIGSCSPVGVNVRIIASTNRDLRKAVDEGRFREDLYYRLRVVGIEVAPLRERREDIPLLVDYLLQRHNPEAKRRYKGVDNRTMTLLMGLSWEGTVRELDHVLQYAMVVGDGEWIRACDLPPGFSPDAADHLESGEHLADALRAFEKAYIETALRRLGGDRRLAATHLGIDPSTLYRKIRDLGIRTSA